MIEVKEPRFVMLSDMAHWERAVKGRVYPVGTTIVQISATRGQTEYLRRCSDVASHYVCIMPKYDVVAPCYLHIVIEMAMPEFTHKYQTGLNIQVDAFKHLMVQLHEDIETQLHVCKICTKCDDLARMEGDVLTSLKEVKRFYLQGMFV